MKTKVVLATVVLSALTTAVGESAVKVEPLNPPIDRKAWMVPSPSQPLAVLKPMPRNSPAYPSQTDYMRVLERFPLLAERGWRANYLGDATLGFFGDPEAYEMGLRSMGNFIFVMSLLASDPTYDPTVTGFSREHVLSRARSCLAYMTRSHVTGDITCGDGHKWGDHWQSAWWTAKMALGAQLIWEKLTSDERAAVERVVTYEADHHLTRQAPSGDVSNTRSEENAWDTEVMAAAISLFPRHPRAQQWQAKLIEFYLNSLSTPQDKYSSQIVDAAPVKDQVYTSNIHDDFTIENHGAYHVCYMSCPLHSFAWGRYAFAAAGLTPPEAQLHHFQDVWKALKPTFLDKRFAYIEGKDWPRYAYGMYFIMPALVVLQQKYGDRDAREIEARRFRTFEQEQVWNADGTFFGKRFTNNIMMDRQAEYETDCYANLGVCYLLHKQQKSPPILPPTAAEFETHLTNSHISKASGFVYSRTPQAFASFAWRMLSGTIPCAQFIVPGMGDAAEWGANNLVGRITVDAVNAKAVPRVTHSERLTPDGFKSFGRMTYSLKDGSPAYTQQISFDVDTKNAVATIETTFTADGPIEVRNIEGLRLLVSNDYFNNGRRVFHSDTGVHNVDFPFEKLMPETETITNQTIGKNWVNIDDRLGIIQLSPDRSDFVLRKSDYRNAPWWRSLHYDALGCPLIASTRKYAKGDTIVSTRFRLFAGDAKETEREAARLNK